MTSNNDNKRRVKVRWLRRLYFLPFIGVIIALRWYYPNFPAFSSSIYQEVVVIGSIISGGMLFVEMLGLAGGVGVEEEDIAQLTNLIILFFLLVLLVMKPLS